MRLFRHPRTRLNAALTACAAFLLLVGTVSHRHAQRRLVRALDARIASLEASVNTLGGLGDNIPPDKALEPANEVGPSEPTHQSLSVLPPRVLGSGRCAGRVYSDIRLSDGEVRRYYLRTNATPAEVSAWVRTIADDARDARIKMTAKIPLDNGGAL